MIAYLRKNGAEVAAYDAELKPERVSQIGKMFDGLVFYTGRLKDALDNGFDILALSPGISERQPDIEAFKQNGGRVLGDIELLADVVNRRGDKVIAITGSNGKTTVTSLVGYLCIKCGLDTVIAGNIGTPVLEAELQREGKKADVWVLELSSFQLENTESLRPTAATVLNIFRRPSRPLRRLARLCAYQSQDFPWRWRAGFECRRCVLPCDEACRARGEMVFVGT